MHTTDDMLVNETKTKSVPVRSLATGSGRRVLRVWVVDDNTALRELFGQLLSTQPGIRCNRQFPSAKAVLATLAEERPPDIILLDIHLGDQNGLAAIRPIRKVAPSVKVLMLTMFSNSYYEAEALRAGASGFLLKTYELAEIAGLIHEAYRNPGAAALFPNVALRKDIEVDTKNAGTQSPRRRFSLVGALRQLCGPRRSQTAG